MARDRYIVLDELPKVSYVSIGKFCVCAYIPGAEHHCTGWFRWSARRRLMKEFRHNVFMHAFSQSPYITTLGDFMKVVGLAGKWRIVVDTK